METYNSNTTLFMTRLISKSQIISYEFKVRGRVSGGWMMSDIEKLTKTFPLKIDVDKTYQKGGVNLNIISPEFDQSTFETHIKKLSELYEIALEIENSEVEVNEC